MKTMQLAGKAGAALALLALCKLAAAGAPTLNGELTQNHKLSSKDARSFAFIVGNGQKNAPDFPACSKLVSEKLRAMGWTELPEDQASVGILLQYAVSPGRTVSAGRGGGNGARGGANAPQAPRGESRGGAEGNAATGERGARGERGGRGGPQGANGARGAGITVFDSSIRMTIFELQAYRRGGPVDQLYDGQFQFTGPSDNLSTLLPALVQGLLSDFPGKSGATRRVPVNL